MNLKIKAFTELTRFIDLLEIKKKKATNLMLKLSTAVLDRSCGIPKFDPDCVRLWAIFMNFA